MAKIVSLKHNASEKRPERTQYLVYLNESLLNEAGLEAGDELEFVAVGKHKFSVRKAR